MAGDARRGASRHERPHRRPLSEEAHERLEEMIVELELLPGAPVSEAMLAQRLGLGRTPIREALQRLAREHLIEVLPHRGYRVSEIDLAQQLRMLEVRREIERLVVRQAARLATSPERADFGRLADAFEDAAYSGDWQLFRRANRRFIALCREAARNEFSAGAMAAMRGLVRRFWVLNYRSAAEQPDISRSYARTARQIARGDEAAAAAEFDTLMDHVEAFTRGHGAVMAPEASSSSLEGSASSAEGSASSPEGSPSSAEGPAPSADGSSAPVGSASALPDAPARPDGPG